MAASLLFNGSVSFSNIPLIEDVKKTGQLLSGLGAMLDFNGTDLKIDASALASPVIDFEIAKNMRASVVFLGPMLARFGLVKLPHPGGCVIGRRPIDFFIAGFQKMGASFEELDGLYKFTANGLVGTEIFLPFPSVTATETLMMAAVLADGQTVIKNAASEPEISQLAELLISGGADITGAGTNTIVISGSGGKLLSRKSAEKFTVMSDRIEAGSFAILASLVGDPLKISGCRPDHLESLLASLESAGVKIERGDTWLEIRRPSRLNAASITTAVYPGFATDLQSPFSILLTQAEGQSTIFETVFEGRLNYLEELKRMGANVVICDPHRAIITGPTPLRGRAMESPDLRAGLAFVIAALIAEGQSAIHNIFHVDRGYSQIEKRLQKIGAKIERI